VFEMMVINQLRKQRVKTNVFIMTPTIMKQFVFAGRPPSPSLPLTQLYDSCIEHEIQDKMDCYITYPYIPMSPRRNSCSGYCCCGWH
jgi:hypothetical protein